LAERDRQLILCRTIVLFAALWFRDRYPRSFAPRSVTAPAAQDAPLIFTALEGQLGLKLRPERALVDVVVIDTDCHKH